MTKYMLGFLVIFSIVGCGEREGVVRYSDCREQIRLQQGDFETFFKNFTCQYYKTKSGLVMGGNCVSVEYDSNGICKSAYIYYKKQDDVCPKEKPILKQDDFCEAN